jgi:signal transduction histidine kinase/ligand-binding sensor domain-containing protein/CheY-like chemotaxis protein
LPGYSINSGKKFVTITTEQGLSTSFVRYVYQDEAGFIWFCTGDGLNRFDGYSIKVFRPEDLSNYSIINSALTFMSSRSDGRLWVGTERGVIIFDTEKEEFSEFPLLDGIRVTMALNGSDGKVWFSTFSGLYCYNSADSSMVRYVHKPNDNSSLSNDQLELIYEDSHKNLWVATQNGLNLFLPETQSFQRYFPAMDGPSSTRNWVKTILEDTGQRLWIGIEKYGLLIFENADERPVKGEFNLVLRNNASSLVVDRDNNLWIGNTLGWGLQIMDLDSFNTGKIDGIEWYKRNGNLPGSLGGNTILDLCEDRDGGIWISTFAGGVSYYSPQTKKFEVYKSKKDNPNSLSNDVINTFLEEDDAFWIGTEEGLNRIDKLTGKIKFYLHDPSDRNSLGANGIICLYKDSQGRIWAGTWLGGLNLYNKSKDNFIRFEHNPDDPASISNDNVFKITEDARGNMWIGTNGGGLNLFLPDKGTFKHYLPESGDPESIYHNAINDIDVLPDGRLLISVYHSLELFDPVSEEFRHFFHVPGDSNSISPGNILDIFIDSRNNIWIATSSGLNLFDLSENSFKRYSEADGLPGSTVQSILEDSFGSLWLSTNHGLSKLENAVLHPEHFAIINFSAADGLSSDEFNRQSAISTRDGWMYFGGPKGYTKFRPEEIILNKKAPAIVFTNFRHIGGKSTAKGKEAFPVKGINSLKHISLEYDQSDFEIEFAALNYVTPQKNRYRYILEGYESEWHHVNQRVATYTNIAPGSYTFRVRGSNNDGFWSDEDKTLEIIIRPPWWKTLIARVIFAMILISFIYLLFHLRFKMLGVQKRLLEHRVKERTQELTELNSVLEEKQEEIILQNDELSKHRHNLEKLVEERTLAMKEALQKAEEADKLKSAFLANMSHEIRTPMNAIVGFAAMLNEVDISDSERKEFIEIINNNSETLMVLINDILEISLIEANQLQLNRSPFSVSALFSELESFFRIKGTKDLHWEFVNKHEEELILYNDPTRFRQIITNLLNNAAKYTESGSVRFGFVRDRGEIRFFVSDTGIGIAESEYENIFNYFHKIDKGDNKLYRGAGIGLSISNKLIDLMGGKIWVESKVGSGSNFYFSLPDHGFKPAETGTVLNPDKTVRSLKGKTIIVAEDEPTNYILIERMLKPTQANVIWAKNGREAVTVVGEMKDLSGCLVLMDIKMPVLNGINASEEIKKLDGKVPVIAVTAYAHANDKEEILKHSFVDYIAKPVKSAILIEKILKHIRI